MKEVPSWYNEESECILNRGYFLRGEDINSAIDRITTHASNKLNRPDLKEKFREMIFNGWVSFSSPIWSNMGTTRGLSISCFGSVIGDSMEEIADKLSENIILTKSGGGTSTYFGKLRPRGASISMNGESSGPISFMHMFDTMILNVAQGSVRRGSHASYLDIDHPDIEEFLKIRDIGSPLQTLFNGVCVPDYWMEAMIDGDREKRDIWAKVLKSRKEKGIPYIFFTDNVNKDKPQIFKDRKLKIHASNLCSEIALPSSEKETFICCLSSLNLAKYDEWKDTDVIERVVYFLDAVLQDYIDKTEDIVHLQDARRFAMRQRSIGIGT